MRGNAGHHPLILGVNNGSGTWAGVINATPPP